MKVLPTYIKPSVVRFVCSQSSLSPRDVSNVFRENGMCFAGYQGQNICCFLLVEVRNKQGFICASWVPEGHQKEWLDNLQRFAVTWFRFQYGEKFFLTSDSLNV